MTELALCWDDLSLFAVNIKKNLFGRKAISRYKLLHNVSGIVRSGELCAIMGPSGAGKTTLLSALGQRNSGVMQGEIHLNGRPIDKGLMKKLSGFVPQQDLVFKTLTVNEHLHFMANMKMDKRVSHEQVKRILESLVNQLNLLNCRFTRLSDLSGGEMKRVSLAVQMLPDPPILLCDEPTTGLDSFSASQVVSFLRQFASKGKLVIASVHQPTSGIFELFDTVCFLVPGGKQAYFGGVEDAKAHFSRLGYSCPQDYNTAEYFIAKLHTNPDKLAHTFESSEAYHNMHDSIDEVCSSTKQAAVVYGIDESLLTFYAVQSPTTFTQLKWLFWRSVLDLYRNAQKVLLQWTVCVATALLIAMPYTRTMLDQEGIQNIQGRNYSVVTETIFTQAYAVMNTFPAEIPILLREIGNGLYDPAPYYISKLAILLPKAIIETVIFTAIVYLVSGAYADNGNFFLFALPVVFGALSSLAYGFCISAMFENIRTASLLSVPFDFVSYSFSGLFLQLRSVPLYMSWIKYTSRFYYGLEAISILQWQNVDNIACSDTPGLPCIKNGDRVLFQYGYSPSNLALDLSGLICMFFILNIIGFIFFARRSKKTSVY